MTQSLSVTLFTMLTHNPFNHSDNDLPFPPSPFPYIIKVVILKISILVNVATLLVTVVLTSVV